MVLTVCAALIYAISEKECFQKISLIIGLVSTSFSTILSLVATIYTFYSGMQTNLKLDNIGNENKVLADDIEKRRLKDSMGANSAKRILNKEIETNKKNEDD